MNQQTGATCDGQGMRLLAPRSPFGDVLGEEWNTAILAGMTAGIPVALDRYPLLVPEAELIRQNRLGVGLGYDVYRLNDRWVLKVSAERHPDAIGPDFIRKQAESYNFLRRHLGDEFVCTTYLFRCPIDGQVRSCEVQQFVNGRSLQEITNKTIQSQPRLRSGLLELVDRILETEATTGRVPDFWDTGFKKNARYTKNVVVDEQDHPWLIDIGAWPEGFSRFGGLRAQIRVMKIVMNLRCFRRWLERVDRAEG